MGVRARFGLRSGSGTGSVSGTFSRNSLSSADAARLTVASRIRSSALSVAGSAGVAALSEAERDDLARRGRHRTLAAGDVLFHAGEKADTCATLTSGALKVTATDAEGNERILALIHPAGFIGEFFQPWAEHAITYWLATLTVMTKQLGVNSASTNE